jgi:5-methylcytosine-specific restriction endonuclease McrA
MKYKTNNPNYYKTKIPEPIKKAIYKRAGNKCEYTDNQSRCIKTTGLSIHHKNPRSNNGRNSMDNLILLCAFHRKVEHGLIKLDENGMRIKY